MTRRQILLSSIAAAFAPLLNWLPKAKAESQGIPQIGDAHPCCRDFVPVNYTFTHDTGSYCLSKIQWSIDGGKTWHESTA